MGGEPVCVLLFDLIELIMDRLLQLAEKGVKILQHQDVHPALAVVQKTRLLIWI